MSAQPTEAATVPIPLRTLGDVRAALAAGLGFPGDAERLERELAEALNNAPITDLTAVSQIVEAYAGRLQLATDPALRDAVTTVPPELYDLQPERRRP
ncbi:hypothetical protein RCO28_25270 [Streptomyces sp. LHD-70]|uniref:hypothetical protein n=1 Tax=Streptomyces sp. LHD-70 TaxID=3072140 RepID=UPI00280EE114|nr:hypothetical protein [Streptomyces sp. LHD-70]MDQ8705782.1 hypothetical protein [Streptomyces sp. LHD-70]